MASLPGGAADKLGNRYEGWWTLFRLADVLRGRASRLRLEPPGSQGVGVEFWVDEPDGRWCEQVKDAPAKGNWTLWRLTNKTNKGAKESEGVLPSLASHLTAGHHVRLVLSTPATDLANLSDRARVADTFDEYREILTENQRPGFERLAKTWDVTEATAWTHLKRVHVEHQPPDLLRRLVHHTYERLVQGDPEVVVNELRGWLDEMLHQTLTAPMIWEHLKTKGFVRRLLAGDPATVDALAATVERHHRRIDAARPVLEAVTQPHVTQLVERLSAPDSRQVVVLHGRAGSGKSTIAADVLRTLTTAGWFAGVVRMDAATPGSQTAAALGRAFDLPGSPAVLLDGVADGAPGVLLVDQLDAVSTYSGRMSDSYDAVAELLDQTTAMPNIKVVLVARTVDLTADPRMRSLLSDETRVDTLTVGDLEPADVRAALERSGVDTAALAETTLHLLRVPLHLSVFSRLASDNQRTTYRTLSDLYERFTAEVRRDVEHRIGHLDWSAITQKLVRYMSDNERLQAPAALLDSASRGEVDALHSRGVLVTDVGGVGFFHETYFDFLFARTFVTERRDLHDFLVDSGQHLFRRAQARQVLEYLAVNDRDVFRDTVVRLLTSDAVRTHLQTVVVIVLRQLDADADDWRTIEPLAFGDNTRGQRLVVLLSSPQWFDAADTAGRWEALLADPSTVDAAAQQLVVAARQRPERVATLVRPHVGTSDAWRLRLRALVQWSLGPALVDLAVELVGCGDLDDIRGPIAVNSDFWSIVYGLLDDDPAGAARLIGAHLRRSLVRAGAEGSGDPFVSEHLSTHSAGGDSTISEVAAAAPAAFITEVLPFVVRVAGATASTTDPDALRSARWGWRYVGDHPGIDGAVFAGAEEALRLLAKDQPEEALALVSPLADSDVPEVRFLACRALAAAASGDDAVDWLLSDERNLDLGWADSRRWASRELIKVATRRCDDEHLNALTSLLLDHYPARETTAQNRQLRGRAQYELLTAVEASRRSAAVVLRIGELERKFADAPPTAPQAVEFHYVGPPIPAAAAEFLTDEDWIRAIHKYRSDETDRSHELPVGGARQLAELLGSRARAEPERFAQLALTFDADTPPVHLSQVIGAVAGAVPVPLLAELCRHARNVAGQDVGQALCAAIEVVGAEADETLLRLLEECATDEDPDHEAASTPADSEQSYYGGDLLTAGLNCTRGAAAKTVAHLLFADPEYALRFTPTVTALAADPILAVRTWAAEAVVALMNSRPEIALGIANDLFGDAPVDVFDSVTACRLMRVALLRDPEMFAPHLRRALAGPDTVAERAGSVWAVAFVHDSLGDGVPTELVGLSTAARRGVAAAFATDPTVAPEQLVRLFDDEDPTVRTAAASAMRVLNDADAATAEMLVASFTASAAYEAHFDDLFRALGDSTRLLPETSITACERAVEIAGRELGDIRTRHAVTSDDIIAVVLRLYRLGDTSMRVRCLDIIDRLSEAGAYGLEEAIVAER
ncbi:MAG: NB-ARC domain-containing protein [Actinomycetota bacterium]|nr:NB-ARC domain-containing protein [Actinomycetota bacterium]